MPFFAYTAYHLTALKERVRTEVSVGAKWPAVVECYETYIKPSKPYAFFQVKNYHNEPLKYLILGKLLTE